MPALDTNEAIDAGTGDTYREVMDFDAGTYELYVNDVLFETRPLTQAERDLDDELNEPRIEPDQVIEEAMKTRAVLRELLQWLVDNVPGFTAQDRQAIVQAGLDAVAKKRS